MHFSIPETVEMYEESETKKGQFTAYHVHVNGVFHCAVRYSQLHNFHTELTRAFGPEQIGKIPPKKLLSLSNAQVEERRTGLEDFMQAASQDPGVSRSPIFTRFLMDAQKEVILACQEVSVNIYLVNGKKVELECLSTDQTDDVLEAMCENIGLAENLTYYFGLFLVQDADSKGQPPRIIRQMQEFESPYISLQRSDKDEKDEDNLKILLRRVFWDPVVGKDLYDDKIALNLIYIQAVADMKQGVLKINPDVAKQLKSLKDKGSKKEFMELSRTIKDFGIVHFAGGVADYPEKGSACTIGVTKGHLKIKTTDTKKEYVFPVTRMRCWKISGSFEDGLEFSFDFLKTRTELHWVNIDTNAAIMISMCLQGMVDEMIRLRKGEKVRRPRDRVKRPKPPIGKRRAQKGSTAIAKPVVPDTPLPPSAVDEDVATAGAGDEVVETVPNVAPVATPQAAQGASGGTAEAGSGRKWGFGSKSSKGASVSSGSSMTGYYGGGFNSAFDENVAENEQVFGQIGDGDL